MAVTARVRAARDRFTVTGAAYFTEPDSPHYCCSYCGDPIPDGNHVAAVLDPAGKLAGVVCSADPNPYTAANFTHRCGAGIKTVPAEMAAHDHTTDEARAARLSQGASE